MISFDELSIFFNANLLDNGFQSFLKEKFDDLTDYNVSESEYITSKKKGIELGFKNSDALYDEDDRQILIKGNPVFSHFNIFPHSSGLFDRLPFDINFNDNRDSLISKAGQPIHTNMGEIPILGKYLIDIYSIENLIISIDYDSDEEIIKYIQIKQNE